MVQTWDAVWLNDEVELLLWRLTILRDVVDRVLVVEGDRLFSGAPKGSCFLHNEARIRAVGVPVEHVVVALDEVVESAWDRENQQRRGLADALNRLAAPGDLVVVADVDEIPRPDLVRRLAAELDRPVRLHMQHANYFANWVQQAPWRNSAWAYRQGQADGHPMLRVHLGNPHKEWEGYVEEYLDDAGWHVSFLGGEDAVRRKWAAYSHQEFNTGVDAYPGHLERCFRYGVHFQGRVLLRKLTVVEPELQVLARMSPGFVRVEPAPSWAAARAYRGWTWLRRHRRFPVGLRRLVDDRGAVRTALLPALLVLDLVLAGKRRAEPAPERFPERPWRAGSQS